MKNFKLSFKSAVRIILAAALLTFLMAVCDNFLKGADLKEELDRTIAFNNAKDISISISCKEEVGSVFPQASYQTKVGYSFEVQFILNEDDYVIKDPSTIFEAVGLNKQSRADCVKFTIKEQSKEDKKNSLYKADVKILKYADDIMIQPVCLPLPYVNTVEPSVDSGYAAANTPITIDFNMNIENSNVLKKLKLSAGDNPDISACFAAPRLSQDKKSVIIDPNPKELKNYITKEIKAAFVEFEVNLEDEVLITVEGVELPLAELSEKVFTVRYKPETESIAPKNYGFFVTTEKFDVTEAAAFTGQKLSLESLDPDSFDDETILQNRSNGSLYIYGKYFDEDSGVKTITLTERRINAKNGEEVNEEAISSELYTARNTTFVKDSIGNTEFCIKYDIQSEDGAILLTLSAEDACGNTSESENKEVVVIKDSGMDLSELELENTLSNLTTVYFYEKRTEINEDTGNETLYIEFDNDDYVNPGFKNRKVVYKNLIIPTDQLSFVVEYKDASENTVSVPLVLDKEENLAYWMHPITYEEYEFPVTDYKWKASLNLTEDMLAERQIKLIVTDDAGNVTEKMFSFPSQPKVSRWEYRDAANYFYFANRGSNDKLYLTSCKNENGDTYSYTAAENVLPVQGRATSGYTYTANCLRGGLYGKATDPFTESDFSNLEVLDDVTVTGISYNLSEEELGYTDVTISIAEDSWDSYEDIYYLCSGFSDVKDAVHFEKGTTSSTFTTATSYLFSANTYDFYYVTIFGVKGNSMTAGLKISPKVSDLSFDNIPPELYSYSPSYNSNSYITVAQKLNNDLKFSSVIACCANDSMSGLDYMTVKISDDKEIKYYADKYYYDGYFIIPYYDLKTSGSYQITVYDKAGNCNSQELSIKFMETPVTSYNDRNYIYGFKTKPLPEERTRWNYVFYEWKNGDWEEVFNYYNDYASASTNYNSLFSSVPVQKYCNWVESNTLYKVIVKFEDKDLKNYAATYPEYFFSGIVSDDDTPGATSGNRKCTANVSGGTYDYIIPKSRSSVLVSSDSLVFVQTLVTTLPYAECKNWSIEEWQYHRKSIGESVLDFRTNTTYQKYTIPVDDDIEEGECYVVIAHFANGDKDISDVYQK